MQDFFNWQGVIGTITGIIGMIISIKAWLNTKKIERFLEQEKARNNEKVQIILKSEDKEYEVKPSLRRKEVTRSEIQGRLGTIKLKNKKEKFYRIGYTNSPKFYEQLDAINNGSNENGNSKLFIECSIDSGFDEFNQFDLPQNEIKILESKIKKEKVLPE